MALSLRDGQQPTLHNSCPQRDPPEPSMPNVLPPQTGSPVLVLQHGQGWGRRAPPGRGEHTAGNPPRTVPPPEAAAARPRADLPAPHTGDSGRPGVGSPRRRRDRPAISPRRPRRVPARSRLRPGPARLPRRLSVLPAACGSVRPGLAPWPPVPLLPCPRRVTWPRGGPRTRACPAPPAANAENSRALPAQPRSGRPPRTVRRPEWGRSGSPSSCGQHCSPALPAYSAPDIRPSAAQRSTLPGPPLLKSLPWLWAFSSQSLSGLSLKAGRHPPTPSPGPPAITPSLASLLCACLWATSLLVRSGADPKTSFLTPTECFF